MKQISSLSIATKLRAGKLRNRVVFPVGTTDVSPFQNVQTGLGVYRFSYSIGTRGSFLWLKWPER